jgi:hypothetical protein
MLRFRNKYWAWRFFLGPTLGLYPISAHQPYILMESMMSWVDPVLKGFSNK